MSLTKKQIDEIETKMKSQDADNILVEGIANPLYVARMKRYASIMGEVYENFKNAGKKIVEEENNLGSGGTKSRGTVIKTTFTPEQAFELTKIALDSLLKSANVELPAVGKSEARGYA